MRSRTSRALLVGLLGGYNLIQNRLLPAPLYVPTNVAVSAGLVYLARRRGVSWEDLGLELEDVGRDMRFGMTGAGVVAAVTAVLARSEGTRALLRDERAAHQGSADILFSILVRFPLGTALFEEVAFRGVVEGLWRNEGATDREAAVVAAVLFALWHLIPTSDALGGNPIGASRTLTGEAGIVLGGAATTGLASLAFSWLRRRSGSLLAPWLVHTAASSAGYLAGVAAWGGIGRR